MLRVNKINKSAHFYRSDYNRTQISYNIFLQFIFLFHFPSHYLCYLTFFSFYLYVSLCSFVECFMGMTLCGYTTEKNGHLYML